MGIRYSLRYTQNFYHSYKRIAKKDKSLVISVEKVLKKLAVDPFSKSLKTHSVEISSLGRVYSSRVNKDIRILWIFDDDFNILLNRMGGHSGSSKVYK